MAVGRPQWQPTKKDRKLVKDWAEFGWNQEIIAQRLKIDPVTLRRHCRAELDHANHEGVVEIGTCLKKNAREGNVTAQIFYLKTRGGAAWRETEHLTNDKTVLECNFSFENKPNGASTDNASGQETSSPPALVAGTDPKG